MTSFQDAIDLEFLKREWPNYLDEDGDMDNHSSYGGESPYTHAEERQLSAALQLHRVLFESAENPENPKQEIEHLKKASAGIVLAEHMQVPVRIEALIEQVKSQEGLTCFEEAQIRLELFEVIGFAEHTKSV